MKWKAKRMKNKKLYGPVWVDPEIFGDLRGLFYQKLKELMEERDDGDSNPLHDT